MMGLVDYGSDSESDKEENKGNGKSNIIGKEFCSSIEVSDSAADNHKLLNFSTSNASMEGELEDMVKPKNWERRLAKKERKLMKRAKKGKSIGRKEIKNDKYSDETQLKDPEKKIKGKAKIPAFGAVGTISADVSDGDDSKSTNRGISSTQKKANASGLIAMLPAPKGVSKKSGLSRVTGGSTFLLPSSFNTKKSDILPKVLDEKEGDETMDFFGLSSTSGTKPTSLEQVSMIPSTCIAETLGPNVKTEDYIHPSQMWNFADSSVGHVIGSDKQIGPQYPDYDNTQHGSNRLDMAGISSSIVDVRVDDALDEDVRSTLLKNINSKQLAKQAMAPLPKSKTIKDQAAKRKHQITYLANLAVAREEALQEQWAENRQMKKMAKQKYGF